MRERERSDPQNATCCMRWGTGHTVNLFVLSVAKSRALNSRFVEGVEKGVCPAKERGRVRGRRTPKALQPVKLNQMRKPQKKASIADRKLDPTRNVWSLFFLASSSAHFDFGPQNKLLILFASQGKKNVNYPLCLNRPTHTHPQAHVMHTHGKNTKIRRVK